MNHVKRILLRNKLVLLLALSFRGGALNQLGFFDFNRERDSKEPLPWITYGAIDFIASTVPTDSRVLELGGGASTGWWLTRGNNVTTLETSQKWAQKINLKYSQFPNFHGVKHYPKIDSLSLQDFQNELFDVIVVDFSGDRVGILSEIVAMLAPNGFIVFDNTDRRRYSESLEGILRSKFGYVSFFGLVPGIHYAAETTIFSERFDKPHSVGVPRRSIDY